MSAQMSANRMLLFLLLAAIALPAEGIQQRISPPSLSDNELKKITSIECLKVKQKDPKASCDHLQTDLKPSEEPKPALGTAEGDPVVKDPEPVTTTPTPVITLHNYPNYKDPVCHSDGSYFCDPYATLTVQERKTLSVELDRLRRAHLVTCPALSVEPINERHLQPFYLGVALAGDTQIATADHESLNQWGQLILSEWNMDNAYAAGSQTSRCQNSALLVILPNISEAVLVSQSCDFICETTGSPKVTAAVLGKLGDSKSSKSVAEAVLAGVKTTYESLPNTVRQGQAMPPVHRPTLAPADNTSMYIFVQRAVYAFAVVALVLSLIVGCLVLAFAPSLTKGRKL
eukprot:TRINITY_DN110292_c0_g1_i1.p1 TRINITY_DN110292_c0_g1~~TRINITY_DN110292_c0_g1_i1.p1  ORF type:complete len:344 (-),score=56.37 TRINITY_DN110292_c0_g1_i1:93-1124(-)